MKFGLPIRWHKANQRGLMKEARSTERLKWKAALNHKVMRRTSRMVRKLPIYQCYSELSQFCPDPL